jgi:hypothetical protein
MHSAPDTLRAQQFALTRALRDPAQAGPANIEPRRLKVYQDLLYNNLHSLLSAQFPVIAGLRGKPWWDAQVHDFFREHRARTPLFPELGREFIAWLSTLEQQGRLSLPFLRELAHYEWAELALAISDAAIDTTRIDPQGNLLDGVPVLSPLAWPLAYRFAVDRIRPEFQPTEPLSEPSFFLLHRGSDFKVRFSRIDALTFALMTQLQATNQQTGRWHLECLAGQSKFSDAASFIAAGSALLDRLRERQIVLGTQF